MQTVESLRTISKILTRAVEIIEAGWTRNAYAKNRQYRQVSFNQPSAVRFCSIGAIHRAGTYEMREGLLTHEAEYYLTTLLQERGEAGIADWNDKNTRKKADIIAGFRDAILNVDADLIAASIEEAVEKEAGSDIPASELAVLAVSVI